MSDIRSLGDALASAGAITLERVVAYLPNMLGAAALILVGLLAARLLRAITRRAKGMLDTLLVRLGFATANSRLSATRGSAIAGTVVYWTVLLIFITAATQVLGLQAFSNWVVRLFDYLPTLVAGLLIFGAGWILSGFTADLVQATASPLQPEQRQLLARVVRVTILVGAVFIGVDQIGIRITFLAIFVGAVALTVGGAVALAAGLGARSYVSNLIAAHNLRDAILVGQTISIAEHNGMVLELTATGVIIETVDGRVMLPAKMFGELPFTVSGRKHG